MNGKLVPSLFAINTNSVIPLYHQIKQNIRELIENEHLKVDELLPSERDLGEFYGVNRLTVRQAITELVSEGYLRRQRGVGTFVAQPKLNQSPGIIFGFSDRMLAAGHAPSSIVISLETIPAPQTAARRLQIDAGVSVYKIVRLRCADGDPVMLETAFLPGAFFPGLDALDFTHASLYRTLAEKYGSFIVEAEESLEPVIMTEYEVEMLKAVSGTPGMLVEIVAFDQHGRAVEFGKSIVRGDKSRFLFRIKHQVDQEEQA